MCVQIIVTYQKLQVSGNLQHKLKTQTKNQVEYQRLMKVMYVSSAEITIKFKRLQSFPNICINLNWCDFSFVM